MEPLTMLWIVAGVVMVVDLIIPDKLPVIDEVFLIIIFLGLSALMAFNYAQTWMTAHPNITAMVTYLSQPK